MEKCKFGVEIQCFVQDEFLNVPEKYYSLRLMPEDTRIPRAGHSVEVMAKRIREIGFEYICYDLRPHDLYAAVNAAKWAAKNDFSILLSNVACQIHAEKTEGFNTWVFPPELVEAVKKEAKVIGLLYDEMNHHQIHPGLPGHTNPWNSIADVSECTDPKEAYEKIEEGYRKIFDHVKRTNIPSITEDVIPVLLHAVARTGGIPGCKVMKEQNTPLTLSICMSAALQYQTRWNATVDLWEGDSGPWYQLVSRNSGHNTKEFMSALKLMVLLNPYSALIESSDLLWVVDSKEADLSEFGETAKRFLMDIRPGIKPGFDARTWRPTVAFVHCEDGNYENPVMPGEMNNDPYGFDFKTRMLLGGPKLANTPAANKWLRAWYHLTWGKCSGKTLHNYFNPLEYNICRRYDVGGTEHDIASAPTLSARWDQKRQETHMHSLFTPLNNVAVFDAYVTPEQLMSARLIILCGSYCTREAQEAVIRAVEQGATCLCQEECAPPEYLKSSGVRVGRGYWWTVSDFDDMNAIEQFLMYRGYQNQWTLLSDAGILRIYPKDPWGNEIDWEIEPPVKRMNF